MNRFSLKPNLQILSAILATILSAFTIKTIGLTFDEETYVTAGIKYWKWFSAPSFESIDSFWALNHEHPPFEKLLAGFGVLFFHTWTGFTDVLTAARLPNLAWVFLAYLFLFKMASEWKGRRVAWFTCFSFFTLPRVTFHSTLAALDYASVSISIILAYLAIRLVKDDVAASGRKWFSISSHEILFGLTLGLGLLTRLSTILMLPPILFLFITHVRCNGKVIRFQFLARSFVLPSIIAFLMFVLFWPWLWHGPLGRIQEYLSFQLNHFTIPTTYFNQRTFTAPWHYPFVMTLITAPEFTVILMITGLYLVAKSIAESVRKKDVMGITPTGIDIINHSPLDRNVDLFLWLCCLFPFVVAVYNQPKYDGVRLFITVFPFLSLMSGYGFSYLWERSSRKKPVQGGLVLCLMWVVTSFIHIQPYGASYYNAFIGGLKGAEKNTLELDFWCSPMKRFIPFLERNSGKKYWLAPCMDTVKGYQKFGLLNSNVQLNADEDSSDLLLLDLRQGFLSPRHMYYYRQVPAIDELKVDGVTIAGLYPIEHPLWGRRKVNQSAMASLSGVIGYVSYVQKNAVPRETFVAGVGVSIFQVNQSNKTDKPAAIATTDSYGLYKSEIGVGKFRICAFDFQRKLPNELCANIEVKSGIMNQVNFVFSETFGPNVICVSSKDEAISNCLKTH